MTTILLIIKFASMATAGVLGLSGLVHSYKDENGKLTKIGRWAFGGILVSSLLSIVILGLEQYQAVSSAAESAKSLAKSAKKQEEISLKLEKTLRAQEKNLSTTKRVADGMEKSLSTQETILKGSETTLQTSQSILSEQGRSIEQQGLLLGKQQLMFNNLTSGNTYCYVSVGFIDENSIILVLSAVGEYPLYDILMDVIDKDVVKAEIDEKKLQGSALWDAIKTTKASFEYRTLSPTVSRVVTTVSLTGVVQKRLHINIWSRYRNFTEELKLVKVKGAWLVAYRVRESSVQKKNGTRPPEKLLLLQQDKNFPTNSNGEIDW